MISISGSSSTFLNALRAFSAQLVLVGHGLLIFKLAPALGEPNAPFLQELGVVAFFVLSGFVITHSTRIKVARTDRTYRFSSYVGDRFSRIYTVYAPALIFVLVVTFAFDQITGSSQTSPTQFVGNLFMFQSHPLFRSGPISNLLGFQFPHIGAYGLGRPFWSIAVEWWFYLAFGALYFAVTKWKSLSLAKRAAAAFAIALSLLVPIQQSLGEHLALVLAWACGSLISFSMARTQQLVSGKAKLAVLSGLVLMIASVASLYLRHSGAYSLTFVAILSAGLLVTIAGLQHLNSLRFSKTCAFFADYSYSLYAIHYPIIMIASVLHLNSWIGLIIVTIVANIASYFFAQLFEKRNKEFRAFITSIANKFRTV